MNSIAITITGIANSGKTALAHKIAAMLLAEGASSTVFDVGRKGLVCDGSAGIALPMDVSITVKEA